MSVQDLRDAVTTLSSEELSAFTEWCETVKLRNLRADLQAGIDQLDRGEGVQWDPEEAWAKICARLAREGVVARNG